MVSFVVRCIYSIKFLGVVSNFYVLSTLVAIDIAKECATEIETVVSVW